MLCGKNQCVVPLVNIVLGQPRKVVLFTGKCNRRCAGDSWTALQFTNLMLGKLRSSTNQAHIPLQHIPELRQLVKLPPPKKWADSLKALVVGSRDRVMGRSFPMLQCPELHNRKGASMASHALLHKQNGAGRRQPDR